MHTLAAPPGGTRPPNYQIGGDRPPLSYSYKKRKYKNAIADFFFKSKPAKQSGRNPRSFYFLRDGGKKGAGIAVQNEKERMRSYYLHGKIAVAVTAVVYRAQSFVAGPDSVRAEGGGGLRFFLIQIHGRVQAFGIRGGGAGALSPLGPPFREIMHILAKKM